MVICNLVCEVKVRRWALPILVIGHYFNWDWLIKKCISTEVKAVPVK